MLRVGMRSMRFLAAIGSLILLMPRQLGAESWDVFDPKVNPFPPTPQFAELFRVEQAKFTGGQEKQSFTSFLFVPKELAAETKYPLIIWLHGLGEIELKQPFGPLNWLSELIFTEPDKIEQYQFFVLAPRCTDHNGWIGTGYLPGDSPDGISEPAAEYFLDNVISQYPIDTARISIVGISAGANAAGYWAFKSPDRFSAVSLMAGGEIPEATAAPSEATFWQFVNRDDEDYRLENSLRFVTATNALGGNAYLTVFPTGGHNVWNRAFLGKHRLLEWLLTKSKHDAPHINVPTGPYTQRLTQTDISSFQPPGDPFPVKVRRVAEYAYSLLGILVVILIVLLCRYTLGVIRFGRTHVRHSHED